MKHYVGVSYPSKQENNNRQQQRMDSIKEEPDIANQFAMATSGSMVWSQAGSHPVSAPQAHMATVSQHMPVAPPPAHAHPSSSNQKPPEPFLDKGSLEAAAFLEGMAINLPGKGGDCTATSEAGGGSLPWAIQNTLLQQFMLDRIMNKQNEGGTTANVSATTETALATQSAPPVSMATSQVVGKQEVETSDPNSIEAHRDVYRRMLNYSSALTQQYYLSQYGYNYMQFSKADSGQATTTSSAGINSQASSAGPIKAQLPSIDSVLLNLSTKKSTNHGSATTEATPSGLQVTATSVSSVPAYGLQALANAAIEADPKAFSEADTDRKDGQKSELSDITDTDDSNMSPSDSSTSQILSPTRNTYSHLLDTNPHISIPAAHSHQYQSVYQSKSTMGTLPGIQHFSSMSKVGQKSSDSSQNILSLSTGAIKHSDLVAAAMKLKVEPSEDREKEIADRTIQERIAAHHAVQQQVQDLTAGALTGNIDAAALLAKLPLSTTNIDSELHRHMERVYDYDQDGLQALQHEPMELTSEGSPGKANSRRKSRGRPTSIESLRDPLARQSSTSSLGGATSLSGDGDDRTYDCEICGKQFSHNDRLRRHRKIHTADKPYKCDICGKGFKEKCNLKHHRFIHTGEKPYKCDTCGKSFNQRSSLKTHQKVHTGEKPFKCELCEKPFAQKYLLRQHMKKHIEINLPTGQ